MAGRSNKKRIVLLDNPFKLIERSIGGELLDWLSPRADVVAHNLDGPVDIASLPEADYIVVLGGDGTILATVRALGSRQMPLIGVNMGKLGFLAEFTVAQLKEQFERIITDDSLLIRRTMLDCRLTGPNRSEYRTSVVNEVAIIAGPPFRMIEVSVRVGCESLALCAGDGLIVATPTGSTAYNLSAGGPILSAGLQAAVITPLAAHSLSFRPLVVDLSEPIILSCRESRSDNISSQFDGNRSAVVTIDGQDNVPLTSEDQVTIMKSDSCFILLRNPMLGQWRILSDKLNWGALPNYGNTADYH